MANIDCTLKALAIPGLSGIDPPFGTKKSNGQPITSREANQNIMMPFTLQRPLPVSENSTTSQIQANCVFEFVTGGISLKLGAAAFNGCRISVINSTAVDCVVSWGQISVTIKAKSILHLEYNGTWDVTDDFSDMTGLIAASLDYAGLAYREAEKTKTKRMQTGIALLKNRGVISGCTISKSTTAIRNVNFAGGKIFMDGMEIIVPVMNNAALIQANNTAAAQSCYAYLYKNGNEIKFACTPLGGTVPDNGLTLYRITVPAGNNEINAALLENVTFSDTRRVEAGYPIQYNSVPYASVSLPFTMLDNNYQVFLDIIDFKGCSNQKSLIYPGEKAANGFKIFSEGMLDTVSIKWTAVKMEL